ncbi:MAG: NAD(P)/FAD-dependent oxidoreductase [Nitrospinota bacterium]
MDYIIIGNSAAAIGAVEAIRKNDKNNLIKIISEEEYMVYSRPLISYLLAEKVTTKRMYFRGEDFYENNKVIKLLGNRAISINCDQRYVTLENKEMIKFDKLLISTGGKPIIPGIKGLKNERVFGFTTWSDVDKITGISKEVKEGVVIGGGMIGIKAAEALCEIGIKVTIVELADAVLSRALDKEASHIIQNRLKEAGVDVITGSEVSEVIGKNSGVVEGVILRDGRRIRCDFVVVAIGVLPNTDIVKGTNIKVKRGIVVDEHMETNVSGIYAAGDVAEGYDSIIGEDRPIPIWPLAIRQGRVAGNNMSGLVTKYSGGFPMNAIEFSGMPTISIGITDPKEDGYEIIKKTDIKKGIHKKIIVKENRIVGAVFVGEIDRAGIITGLIKDKIDIRDFKNDLLYGDLGLISLPKGMRIERLGSTGG